ncbi:putative G2/mitotic-specific cyclin [Clavispora lusitaniae]|uniref:G2/mitotic-specific cyclin n=1 Tax=Clavispora lusitaniae TaxID=36911 RepID=A0AA91Q2I2_CLALS|nr:putative G2/mitotic-specific cyclin [Clavispora lusitaniae]
MKPRPYPYVLEVLETQANRKLVGEYHHDIRQWLASLEPASSVNPAMIDMQPEVQWYMRPYLLDFLIELHQSFRMQPATLFLCVNIIDRYCAKRIVFKRHYQLVGCTALWIAAKYEDKKSRVPTLRELAVMCRHAYDEEMFLQMEFHILSTLEWSLSHPSLEDCLQMAIADSGVSDQSTPCKYSRPAQASSPHSTVSAVAAVGRFFCELSLYDRFFLSVPTSVVAAAANLLACSMLGVPAASSHLRTLLSSAGRGAHASSGDENTAPPVVGPFLSGFDSDTLAVLRDVAIMLFRQTATLSDVLVRKYEALGVLPVVHNFSNRHPHSAQTALDTAAHAPDLARAADVLMSLSPEAKQPPALPLTPPSATSSSVFSSAGSAYTTPVLRSEPQFYSPDAESVWASPVPSRGKA